jgi:hypothetical protein
MRRTDVNPETLEALKGSIEKWRKIVEEKGEDRHCQNCPLCQLFHGDDDCNGCPVQEATRRPHCAHTPYYEYAELSDLYGRASTTDAMNAARAELEFLRSLLPKETTE